MDMPPAKETSPLRLLAWRLAPVLLIACVAMVLAFFALAPHRADALFRGLRASLDFQTPTEIVIATGSEDGAYHRYARALAEELEAAGSRFNLRIVSTGGSMENLRLLQSDEVDFGFIQGGLQGLPGEVHGVANIGLQYAHLVVPADQPWQSPRDLAGKRIGVGPSDGGSAALANVVMKYFGHFPEPVLVRNHDTDLEAAFRTGEVDALFLVYGLFAPAMEELLATGYFRLLPMTGLDGLAAYHDGLQAAEIPHAAYGPSRGIPEAALPALAVDTLIVAGPRAADPHVSAVLEAVYRPNFRAEAHLPGLDETRGQKFLRLAAHPEAGEYYQRHAPLSSDAFEIGSFFLAGLVGLVSLAHYLMTRRAAMVSRRKRQAIVPFFENFTAYGEQIEAATQPEELMAIVHDLMGLQRQAEQAWLRGKLETEDMENLYLVYSIRSQNAFNKMLQCQLAPNIVPPPADFEPDPVRVVEEEEEVRVENDEEDFVPSPKLDANSVTMEDGESAVLLDTLRVRRPAPKEQRVEVEEEEERRPSVARVARSGDHAAAEEGAEDDEQMKLF